MSGLPNPAPSHSQRAWQRRSNPLLMNLLRFAPESTQRVFAPFDVAVRRALADPVGLPDMKIGPVFAPIFKHHQKLIFDAERGLATGRLLLAFGVRKHRRHRFKCVPLDTGKPPDYFPFQLFDRIKSHRRLPLAATNQTGVKRRLCKRSSERLLKAGAADTATYSDALFCARKALAQHALLRAMRDMATWFCDAYASWQKGGVENADGRLRRWLPCHIDIDRLSDGDIQDIVMTANLTPRKCLGFQTPLQAILKELGKDVRIRFS